MKKILLFSLSLLFSKTILTMDHLEKDSSALLADFNSLPRDIKKNIIASLIEVLPNQQTIVKDVKAQYDSLSDDDFCSNNNTKIDYKQSVQKLIRSNLMSLFSVNKELSALLVDQEYMGQLICALACKYNLSNYEIAEMIDTRTAVAWCIAHPQLLTVPQVARRVNRVLFPSLPTTRQLLFSLHSLKLTTNAEKENALRLYAHAGDLKAVLALIQSGCNVNAFDDMDKTTALHKAVKLNNIPMVDLLLMQQAHVDVRDELGRTPLMNAVARNFSQLATRLMLAHADRAAQDTAGKTAYSIAVENNNSDMIRLLDCFEVLAPNNR
ncbi:ankyrin repeat domain-containing protein [Candidatus Dependentiae bacterium]|nr:ankyrin repeat domain-containing protein [Candidatus Dependentiae bacterium]